MLMGKYRTIMLMVYKESSNLFKVYINGMSGGVTVGEDKVSGSMFADDFVGISETPERLLEQIGKELEYTGKWRVTANVNTVRSSFRALGF